MGIKTRDNNVGNLKNQHKNLKGEQTTKDYSLIDLYGKGNIHNINTLRYEINKLLAPSDNKLRDQLAYFKTMVKYLEPSKVQRKKQSEQEEKIKQLLSNIPKNSINQTPIIPPP